MGSFDWAVVEGGGIADRYETEAEAVAAVEAGGYPAGAQVVYSPQED